MLFIPRTWDIKPRPLLFLTSDHNESFIDWFGKLIKLWIVAWSVATLPIAYSNASTTNRGTVIASSVRCSLLRSHNYDTQIGDSGKTNHRSFAGFYHLFSRYGRIQSPAVKNKGFGLKTNPRDGSASTVGNFLLQSAPATFFKIPTSAHTRATQTIAVSLSNRQCIQSGPLRHF